MLPVWSLELTDGDETINLGMVQPPSVMAPVLGGFGPSQITPHGYDELAQTVENQLFLENWNLVIGEGDTDALSTQVSKLLRLLRRAWQYWRQDRYNTPVYLIERGACETESRYAIVRECPQMNLPKPLANNAFESTNLIDGAGVSIARYIWREGIPGALPSLSTLTKTDGPEDDTLVHVSNFQDNHEMTHVYTYSRNEVNAADFESTDPDRMWIADNASLSAGDIDFYIYGWFTFESFAGDNGFIAKWDGGAANSEYLIYYASGANRLQFYVSDGVAVDTVTADTFGALSIATEYFVVAWHIAATSEIGISINGIEDTKISARFPQDGALNFTLGALSTGFNGFDGLVKSVGVCKTECTAALRTSLYNCGVPKFYAELTVAELVGLEAYWEFGSGGLAFVNDSEGANNLTNVGAVQIVGAAAVFSANLYQSGTYGLFPATPKLGDILYLGSPTPFWHFMAQIVTAGDPVGATFLFEYSNGAAGWPDLTLGDDLTLYPDDEPWDTPAGDDIAFNFMPGSDWALETVNGQNRFWVRVRITTCPTTWATMTQVDDDYNQRTPEVRLPANISDGDISPYLMLRLRHPDGGDENPEMSTTSRIIIGKKSRGLDNFESRLNLGNDGNPAGWAVTYGVDAAAAADPRTPGGDWCNIDFAGDSTMIVRATVTGTAFLGDLEGEYRVFMRVFQTSGDAEDMNVQMVVKINSAGADAPAIPFPERPVQDGGVGELIDMTLGGTLKIPFADAFSGDDFTNGDIVFEIYAERAAGAGELDLMDLILIPADEWIVDLNDPISNANTGNSALRGLTLLDMDSGIISNRTVKQIIDGDNIYLAETWSRRSNPMNIEPATAARLYFLMAHFPSGGDWGDTPWIGSQGMHLAAELYKQNTFLYLRGDT